MKALLYILLAVITFSCANKYAEEAAKLKTETFKLHDEIMPVSMELETYRNKVMKKAETMDSTAKNQALEISKQLDQAYTDMEAWMPKLGDAADMKDGQEKVTALTELKAEGNKLKQKTIDARKKAEDFLK
ncbi:hypothetical protein [Emticicia sp. TH156]|uniref:hypothetical protein n=1 Tax=Emticicia sp. TH156 TaxID=2067454 RepID=UPI000C77CD1C|nr:hypothetical protein [Emticicia sp. TH156]PLK43443.1 hypothetical protein C0V77_16180 [Emticicia sp. TH156]